MKKIVLYIGEGIDAVIGEAFYSGLDAFGIEIMHKHTVTDIDINHITHSVFALPTPHAIVGIGGGMALDYAKYAAHILQLPYISIPTAISNDGFSSPSASLKVDSKRISAKASNPYGVVIDLAIIKNSPDALLYSGIGDMMSKATALHDWRNAREKGMARYVDLSAILAYNSLDIMFLKYSFNIHDENFQRSLASSLTMSGLAMAIAGSSRPASGSEHLISHALDATATIPRLHGIQVGVATYLCALLQNNPHSKDIYIVLEQTGFLAHVMENPLDYNDFVTAVKQAPTMKQHFYTILSEPESEKQALHLIEANDVLKKLIN